MQRDAKDVRDAREMLEMLEMQGTNTEHLLGVQVLPGTLVPRATNARALTESFKEMKQPR